MYVLVFVQVGVYQNIEVYVRVAADMDVQVDVDVDNGSVRRQNVELYVYV